MFSNKYFRNTPNTVTMVSTNVEQEEVYCEFNVKAYIKSLAIQRCLTKS